MFFNGIVMLEYYVAIVVVSITVIIISLFTYYTRSRIIIINHEGITTKIVSDTESCIKILNELKDLNPYILGLDCEWVGKNKVCLLQLGHPKLIILIRLHKLKTIPTELIGLMLDMRILKCGVGIANDINKLRNDYNIDVNGCIDINNIIPLIHKFDQLLIDFYGNDQIQNNNNNNSNIFGLNKLSQILLKQAMKFKDKKITRSNWEISNLTKLQIHYAADDAIIGFKLFKKCMELQDIEHDIDKYLGFCFGLIDVATMKIRKTKTRIKQDNSLSILTQNEKNSEKEQRRINHHQKHKESFFDNCRLLKPDGSLLFYCSKKSMQWYLKKELAISIDENTVQLLFTPKIKNEESLSHYKTTRVNHCFVCGKTGALCQFDIVPKQYRFHMDDKFKNKGWRLHDYIPLCVLCHPRALRIQTILIESLCKQYKNIPYYKIRKGDEKHKNLCNAKRASKALNKHDCNIPIKRKIELIKLLCNYFKLKYKVIWNENDDDNNDDKEQSDQQWNEWIIIENNDNLNAKEIIKKCMNEIDIKVEKKNSKSQWDLHAKAMLEIYCDKQPQFIEMWRKHFYENMKPRHLPDTWSVSTSNMLDQIDVTL